MKLIVSNTLIGGAAPAKFDHGGQNLAPALFVSLENFPASGVELFVIHPWAVPQTSSCPGRSGCMGGC